MNEKITEVLAAHRVRGYDCSCGADVNHTDRHVAEAVVAAIRAMTPTEQAELIGGYVWAEGEAPGETQVVVEQTRGPWREVAR